MLVIKTRVAPSEIHGLGLFTEEDLVKGQIYWVVNKIIDQSITRTEMASLPSLTQKYLRHYAWQDTNGDCYISLDNDKFMNHSDSPNTDGDHPEFCITSRDIKAGEELTCDYSKVKAGEYVE